MRIPIVLLTVFSIILSGCLIASALSEPTSFNNPHNSYAGNGYGSYNSHGTHGLDGNSGSYYYPNGNSNNNYPNGNSSNYYPNGNGGTTTATVNNLSSNGTTTYKLCSENECHTGGDGSFITITNYENAKDPTYDQLIAFLKKDKTDEHPYIIGQYVCTEFAKTLHNNAEKSGIKAAFIGCDFKKGGIGHAFNMFNTTDKGIVYIDCTGVPRGSIYEDKILNCVVGQPLTDKYLFKEGSPGESMGTVGKLYVYW